METHSEESKIPKLYTEDEVIQLLIDCCGEIYCDNGLLKGKSASELYVWIKENMRSI
jgi:hypothetical protein